MISHLVAAARFELSHASCRAYFQPVEETGGDYYDFFDLGEGRLAFVLADVACKGAEGAHCVAALKAALRAQPVQMLSQPAKLVSHVNRLFLGSTRQRAAMFYGVYDADADTLIYVNCGNTPAVICRANGEAARCAPNGAPVGLVSDHEWEEQYAAVEPGDRILVCSDGVMDADRVLDDRTQVEIRVKPYRWIQ